MLFSKPDSPELHAIGREKLEELWVHALGIEIESLDTAHRLTLSFFSAGVTAIVGAKPNMGIADLFELFNSPVGQTVRKELNDLASKNNRA